MRKKHIYENIGLERPDNLKQRRFEEYEKRNNLVGKIRCLVYIVFVIAALSGVILDSKGKVDSNSKSNNSSTESPYTVPFSVDDVVTNFGGRDYFYLNDNKPGFTQKEIATIEGEHYSDLDELGRCGVAYAKLDKTMMPTVERESIGQIKPSGWKQAKYPTVIESSPSYLYNRCHLIAYALTGQNANEKNLITGTRYMNATSMLSWEMKVINYLESSDNHVLYRVKPYFIGNELVARGVEMEAYSIEDYGKGISFHVFIYNYQPGIRINYLTGESEIE